MDMEAKRIDYDDEHTQIRLSKTFHKWVENKKMLENPVSFSDFFLANRFLGRKRKSKEDGFKFDANNPEQCVVSDPPSAEELNDVEMQDEDGGVVGYEELQEEDGEIKAVPGEEDQLHMEVDEEDDGGHSGLFFRGPEDEEEVEEEQIEDQDNQNDYQMISDAPIVSDDDEDA